MKIVITQLLEPMLLEAMIIKILVGHYINHQQIQFFDEGEGHIPPRPYVYLAQNPTLENAIKLQSGKKKMEVTNQITQLLIEASKPMDIKN